MKQLPFLNDAADRSATSDASANPTRASTPAVVNPRRPAIIVPVQATEPRAIEQQCHAAASTGLVDVIEWRIDPIVAGISSVEAVLRLAANVTGAGLPVLITLRTGFEGGTADVSEDVYAEILGRIIEGASNTASGSGASENPPLALDVETDRQAAQQLIDAAHEHGIRVVASHHNFAGTDDAATLIAKFCEMSDLNADVAKVAMMPQSAEDVLEVMRATAEADADLDCPVLGISMGELGRTSRVMGADFGSCASFAQLGDASAPGQIDVAGLAAIFDRLYD